MFIRDASEVVHAPFSATELGRGLCGATSGRTSTFASAVNCRRCLRIWNGPASVVRAV